MTTVRCVDCGYLAVRHFQTRQLVEVEPFMRDSGKHPDIPNSKVDTYDRFPICFVRAWEIHIGSDTVDSDKFVEDIVTGHECDKFTPWHQGHSPKEHWEMKFREEQKEQDRQQREEDKKRDRQWRQEDVKAAEDARKETNKRASRSMMIVVLCAVMALMGTIISTYISVSATQKGNPTQNTLEASGR